VQSGNRRINHLNYTAPAVIKSAQTVTVSGGDSGQAKASATVTLVP
jgi:hypothetical protein